MNKTNFKRINTIVALFIVLTVGIILLFRSGVLSKAPKVETLANNTYMQTLVVITDKDYRPYSFISEEGTPSGRDVELINMIANDLHMNLELRMETWEEGINDFVSGNADVLMTCDYSDSFDKTDDLLKSIPISTDDFVIYSKKEIPSSDVLYGSRIAVMKNGNVKADIERMNLGAFCVEYEDNTKAMQAVIDGKADYAVMRQTVGTIILRQLKRPDLETGVSVGQSHMCFAINSDKEELVSAINDSIARLKENGEIEKLRNKWLTTFVRPYTFREILRHNVWIAVILFGLALMCIMAFITFYNQKRKINEESFRYNQVIERLAQDFGCVNYIKITDDPKKDPVVNYRISQRLKELIPGWEEKEYFYDKLLLLRDYLVLEEDKEQFMQDVSRDRVLEAFKNEDVYFVNINAFFDGEIHYYQMKFSPACEDGKIIGIVAGLHSVDEQTKKEMALQKQLQEALLNAESSNRAKTEFLFNMSHDIRTPMNAIMGFTNMTMKYIDDKEKSLDCLYKIQQSGNLLLSLINSVLDVSRIESGNAVLEEKKGDVYKSFISIESTMKELASAHDIELSFEFGEIKNRFVYADFNRTNRIFVNIISNGIKYTNPGGYVKARCEQLGEPSEGVATYKYIFEDNGIGMSEGFKEHVFEKFSREKNATLSGIQGTGLGMAVCKSFVDIMGGTIECESQEGKGTIFTVILPFKIQEGRLYTDHITGEVLSIDEEKVDSVFRFEGKRILLCEDNELNREIAVDILEDEDLVVETAENGQKALEMLKEKGEDYYDFILMDIQMPVMDGYEATRAIRKMFPEKRIPIIALSANAFSEDKKASIEAGMDDHVAKPIVIAELNKVLTKLNG